MNTATCLLCTYAAADKAKGRQSMKEGTDTEEEGLQILRRARKRRRRETQSIVLA